MILTYVFLLLFFLVFVYLVFNVVIFLKLCNRQLSYATGLILDIKVDIIVKKAVSYVELQATIKFLKGPKRESFIMEQASSVCTDVLLQNGINPKSYNLPALIDLYRYDNNLHSVKKGGE